MMRYLLLLGILGSVLTFTKGEHQFHRETVSSKANRLQRQIAIGAYPISLNQHYAKVAVADGQQASQNTQLFLQHLAGPQSPLAQQPQQIQYIQQSQGQVITNPGVSHSQQVSGGQETIPPSKHVIRLVDQYGNLVGEHHPGPAPVQLAHVPQPQTLVVHSPAIHHVQPAPVLKHIYAQGPLYQHVVQPGPAFHHHVVQPAPHYHQIVQPAPHYHQVVQPAEVVHEVPQPLPHYHGLIVPQPVYQHVHHDIVAPAAPLVHETVYPVSIPQTVYQPLKQFIPQPQPFFHFQKLVQPAEVPVVSKLITPLEAPIVPVVQKTIIPAPVEVTPELHIIKQPVLPPAVFQKQIFAIKNPPIKVLTYSDLCTVYPYQRKLRGCVIKKGQLPELHHPDIQLVSEESQKSSPKSASVLPEKAPIDVTKAEGNIQDILRNGANKAQSEETFLPLDETNEDSPSADTDSSEKLKETEKLTVESSNKKETSQKVKKLRISRITTTKRTTTTTEVPKTSSSTTKKPKRRSTKRRSSSSRRQKTTSSTTTERSFKLA